MFTNFIQWVQEWKGRLIAYGGGSSVSVFSGTVAAKAQEASDAALAIPEITTANLISFGGLVVIAGRLAFDIYVYVDQKRKKRNKNNGCKTTNPTGR